MAYIWSLIQFLKFFLYTYYLNTWWFSIIVAFLYYIYISFKEYRFLKLNPTMKYPVANYFEAIEFIIWPYLCLIISIFNLPYAIEVLTITVVLLCIGYIYDVFFLKRELSPIELGITFSIIFFCFLFLWIFNWINSIIDRKRAKVILEQSMSSNSNDDTSNNNNSNNSNKYENHDCYNTNSENSDTKASIFKTKTTQSSDPIHKKSICKKNKIKT